MVSEQRPPPRRDQRGPSHRQLSVERRWRPVPCRDRQRRIQSRLQRGQHRGHAHRGCRYAAAGVARRAIAGVDVGAGFLLRACQGRECDDCGALRHRRPWWRREHRQRDPRRDADERPAQRRPAGGKRHLHSHGERRGRSIRGRKRSRGGRGELHRAPAGRVHHRIHGGEHRRPDGRGWGALGLDRTAKPKLLRRGHHRLAPH